MARREIPMNEVVETIYQWHKGMKIQHISTSLGLDRKTVRKYVHIAGTLGITQGGALPDERDSWVSLKGLLNAQVCSFETPALDLIARHKDEIKGLLGDERDDGQTGVAALKGEPWHQRRLLDGQALPPIRVRLRQDQGHRPHRDPSG